VVFWKQKSEGTTLINRVEKGKIASFFRKHCEELAPESIFRAKVWGRADHTWQRDFFVDSGLLPEVEKTAGENLKKLLERAVMETKSALGWKKDIRDEDGKWLLKSVFWILAVKILKDKGVHGFKGANLSDLESAYQKLARHYDRKNPKPVQIDGSERREALLIAAEMIGNFGHCGAVTTESLAWVYESALIDRATRQKLGTHSTPTWLVDEIVAKLRPWIKEMEPENRRVFEPACGHSAFLISAMRLLSELLPPDRTAEERKIYLRQRLHGIEIDSFAYEVAKLSLTLADVPNDNGWMLDNCDMFIEGRLKTAVSKATIVLANPPYEKFEEPRPEGAMHRQSDETFRQIVESLPMNGVFGVVLPLGILHSTQASEIRRKLRDDFEISEITLFADKVFKYGAPETAVIIGRRVGRKKRSALVNYRRVREDQVAIFAKTLIPTTEEKISPIEFEKRDGELFIPILAEIWKSLGYLPRLKDFVEGGKGIEHKGEDDSTLPKGAVRVSETEVEGLPKGFAGWNELQLTHELPKTKWINLDQAVIRRPLHGTRTGCPQILLNYPGVSRKSWRLKALVDMKGHPVTSDFNVLRYSGQDFGTDVLWGILNSPLANAYAYAHSSKRHVLVGTMREMPMIDLKSADTKALREFVQDYRTAAKGTRPLKKRQDSSTSSQMPLQLDGESDFDPGKEVNLKYLHWRIDAEVLRLYNLPADHERRILDLFTGVQRRGVPFVQNEYFPKGFTALDRLSEMLAITADWDDTNERRCILIRKDVRGGLKEAESDELAELERLADARIALTNLLYPTPPSELDLIRERLILEGKWDEE